ncbi:hypothetical protein ABVT39_002894 [Epinephelus coioides]
MSRILSSLSDSGLEPKLVHFHVPVNERQSIETLKLSPPLFQQRHIIQRWSRCSAPTLPVRSFTAETKCPRPTNASLCPLLNSSTRVPSLTAWMCQHSSPFKSMRRTLLAGNGTLCRPDSNLTTRGLFPAD